MEDQFDEVPVISVTMSERNVRAINSAIEFTLEKWAGQGDMDQETLINLRTQFRGMILEFT